MSTQYMVGAAVNSLTKRATGGQAEQQVSQKTLGFNVCAVVILHAHERVVVQKVVDYINFRLRRKGMERHNHPSSGLLLPKDRDGSMVQNSRQCTHGPSVQFAFPLHVSLRVEHGRFLGFLPAASGRKY